ncbi:MAG: hypothetical protein JOS17DRAFT_751745 [Linnemannia elongata]|nr:MAG: hypothetical protein JOS17DRAFT_751745 [Linnemannia elongata]
MENKSDSHNFANLHIASFWSSFCRVFLSLWVHRVGKTPSSEIERDRAATVADCLCYYCCCCVLYLFTVGCCRLCFRWMSEHKESE